MTNEQKNEIANFISRHVEYIKKQRLKFDATCIKDSAKELYEGICNSGTDSGTAGQYIEDALRYLAFFLADIALHSQAMYVGRLLNTYRSSTKKQLRIPNFWKKVLGFFTGYMFAPQRVLMLAGIVFLLFTTLYYSFWLVTKEPTIVYDNGQAVELYYYPYFSLVTLTTVGFGDMRPNTQLRAWGCIPAYLAGVEALAGYIVLALFVVVMIIRLRTHPYARVANWLKEYDEQMLKGGNKPLLFMK